MEQNSNAWLEWRRQGIGASDVPIILGLSDFKTAYQLWEDKLGYSTEDPDKVNFIAEKGHRLEPRIRALYEVETGDEAPSLLAQHSEHDHYRASLDGYIKQKNKCVEIKFVGKTAGEKWQMALKEKIPRQYEAQMQWQMLVSGAETVDYVAYNEEEDRIIIIPYSVDKKWLVEIIKEVEKFWKFVTTKKEPPLSDKDYKKVTSKVVKEHIAKFVDIKKQINELATQLEHHKKYIFEHATHKRMIHDNVKIITKTRQGNVDYKKLLKENLPNINQELYRKPPTTYKEIRL